MKSEYDHLLASEVPSWVADSEEGPGHYRLGPLLGDGGMGSVRLGWDSLLQRMVAIKQLKEPDPTLLLRLTREAQFLAKLNHPNICNVLKVGTWGGRPYVIMDFINGPSLAEVGSSLSESEMVRLVADVASALWALHRRGLVHRDVKPGNILVRTGASGQREAVLVDFGLATDLYAHDLRLSWALIGTPAYMSPEQAMGREAGPASDLYSLGVTLLSLLTQQRPQGLPMDGRGVSNLWSDWASSHPSIPASLRPVLQRCLRTDPRSRYASALDLERDLRRWLRGRPLLPSTRFWESEMGRWVHRRRRLVVFSGIAAILVAAFGGYQFGKIGRQGAAVRHAESLGMDGGTLEEQMRAERLLPPHDLRPAEARIRQVLRAMEHATQELGIPAQGSDWAVQGKGYLLLGDHSRARVLLEKSLSSGYRDESATVALGQVYTALYLKSFADTQSLTGLARKQAIERLEKEFLEPAERLFATYQATESGAGLLGQAQVALLRQDWRTCFERLERVAQHPKWAYDGLLLEGEARMTQAFVQGQQDIHLFRRLMQLAWLALDKSAQIGRSDPRRIQLQLSYIVGLSQRETESGVPTLELFHLQRSLLQELLIIHPDDPAVLQAWASAALREGLFRLSVGEDPTQLCSEALMRLWELPRLEASQYGTLGFLAWVCALADHRSGRDPWGHLGWGLLLTSNLHDGETNAPVELGLSAAQVRLQAGADPSAYLEPIWGILARLKTRGGPYFYNHVLATRGHLLQAQWAESRGLDSEALIQQALAESESALRLGGTTVFAHLVRGQALLQMTQRRHALGFMDQAGLSQALRAAETCITIRPEYAPGHALLAECHLWQSKIAPKSFSKALATARMAAERSLKFNARDPRAWWILAQIEQEAVSKGGSSRVHAGLHAVETCLSLQPGHLEAQACRALLMAAMARHLPATHRAPQLALARDLFLQAQQKGLVPLARVHEAHQAGLL